MQDVHSLPEIWSQLRNIDPEQMEYPQSHQVSSSRNCHLLLVSSQLVLLQAYMIMSYSSRRVGIVAVAWPLGSTYQQFWAPLQYFMLVGKPNQGRIHAIYNGAKLLAIF